MASAAAADESPGPTRGWVFSGGEVHGSKRVDNLFNTRPVEWDLVVIGIAEMSECELVMSTLIRLEGDFATRSPDGLEKLARSSLVLLQLVVHQEGTSATKNKRSRDSSVTRAPVRVSVAHIIPAKPLTTRESSSIQSLRWGEASR
jgi:hypothetical protein